MKTVTTVVMICMVALAGCQKIETPKANRPVRPDSSHTPIDSTLTMESYTAARVEKAMAAADITLPQVVTYLNGHGLDVVDRSAWQRPHWAPSIVDAQHPKPTYYLLRPYIATADTTVEFMVRRHISGAWPADVQGVWIGPDGTVVKGLVSPLGWNDNGTGTNALPGLGR